MDIERILEQLKTKRLMLDRAIAELETIALSSEQHPLSLGKGNFGKAVRPGTAAVKRRAATDQQKE